jgi:hypothetical protein
MPGMFTDSSMIVMAGLLLTPVNLPADPAPPQVFVQLIVKACPSAQTGAQSNRPKDVLGYYADPINQGKSYENERAPTREEREAMFAEMHCIDVPVPPEWISVELTSQACKSHVGYMIAMQYLQQTASYKESFPDVGQWQCIEQPYPVQGVAGM